jgi:adenylate kinase
VRLILLGPPGAGKGTQAGLVARTFGIPHIATGDILRENVRLATPLGREAQSYMDRGDLVPDDVVIGMVEDRLDQADAEKGFLLDGFPRTAPQAEALDELLEKRSTPLAVVVRLLVPDDVIVERITGRRTCVGCGAVYHVDHQPPKVAGVCDECGGEVQQRSDDTEEVVRRRLEEYREKTRPLEDFFGKKGLVRDIDGVGPVEEVSRRMLEVLSEFDEGGEAA